MKKTKEAPRVTEYLDVIAYLQDYYQWRKSTNKDFSYAFWSEELEFSSRSYIRMIIMGQKKVTKKFVEAFTRLNFNSPIEEEYFDCLVKHSQSPSQKDRKLFGAKMIQLLRATESPDLLKPEADFVSDPTLPRLFTILGMQDIYPTAPKLANLLNLSLSEMNACLAKLEEYGLATQAKVDGEIHWSAAPERFKVPDSHGNSHLMKFHERSLHQAIQAFHQPTRVRKYRSLLLPLTDEDLGELYGVLDEFASQQVSRFNAESFKGRRLFQMNINIHPVTIEASPAAVEALE